MLKNSHDVVVYCAGRDHAKAGFESCACDYFGRDRHVYWAGYIDQLIRIADEMLARLS
jgi:hypothetical protein